MIYSICQYNALQLHQKAIVLGENAVFVMSLVEDNNIYSLYSYFSFYVEVHIQEDSRKLINITAFKGSEALDKYLDNVVLIGL